MRQHDPSVRRCRYCDKPLLESSLLRRTHCDRRCAQKAWKYQSLTYDVPLIRRVARTVWPLEIL